MVLTIQAEPVPLELDTDDVIRVSDTRVTLDTVVDVFNEGATAEEIVYQYPSLRLADVYAVISYYLQNSSAVEQYLRRRKQVAARVRAENETRFSPVGIRERLTARYSVEKG